MNEYPAAADLKSRAREFLHGKYTPFAGAVLCLLVITVLLNNLFSLFLSGLIQSFSLTDQVSVSEGIRFFLSLCEMTLITNLIPGLCLFGLKLANHGAPVISDLFYAYKNNIQKNIIVSLLLSIPRLLFFMPFLIYSDLLTSTFDQSYLIPSGISLICGLLLSLPADLFLAASVFLLLDFPGYSTAEVLTAACRLLRKHWQKYLYLELSFLPVICLCILSLGTGLLWGLPYLIMTYTYQYLEIMKPGH